jgi:hypothetical protein
MRPRDPQQYLPGFESRARARAPVARLDDPRTLIEIELVVEFVVSCLDVIRPKKKARAPIDRADIADCRHEIEIILRAKRLPVPDWAWLDDLIIELAAWWFERPLAADIPPPQIDVLREPPQKRSTAPAFDGPVVGWDPWHDDD